MTVRKSEVQYLDKMIYDVTQIKIKLRKLFP